MIIMKHDFKNKDIKDFLIKGEETEELINYGSFVLCNPITDLDFPEFDELYYTHLEYSLRHLLYKYKKGWIPSNRQVMYSSDECISTIHFVFNNKDEVTEVNVFQRSSNLNNLKEDAQFLNYFINKYLGNNVHLNIMISVPHIYKNKRTKVD